jgi:large subunit ribosomal protein L30
MLKITLVKSTIGRLQGHKATVEALGLKKIGSSVVREDTAAVRGAVKKVSYLVKVEEI